MGPWLDDVVSVSVEDDPMEVGSGEESTRESEATSEFESPSWEGDCGR
jgi:hypothetical protein